MPDEGYREVFVREYPRVVRELRLVVGSGVAEDVASDAFEQLYRAWPKVSTYDKPGAWVRLVALRMAHKARRRALRRPQLEATSAPVASEPAMDVDLLQALARLSFQQRASIALHYLAGFTAREIGEVLGCEAATVRTHLYRGRRRLAELLDDPPQEVVDAAR